MAVVLFLTNARTTSVSTLGSRAVAVFGHTGCRDKASPYRRIDSLRKYEIVEPKIMVKALRTISEHYEESPFIFSLYVFWILNHSNQQEADENLCGSFSNETSNAFDNSGIVSILNINPAFHFEPSTLSSSPQHPYTCFGIYKF